MTKIFFVHDRTWELHLNPKNRARKKSCTIKFFRARSRARIFSWFLTLDWSVITNDSYDFWYHICKVLPHQFSEPGQNDVCFFNGSCYFFFGGIFLIIEKLHFWSWLINDVLLTNIIIKNIPCCLKQAKIVSWPSNIKAHPMMCLWRNVGVASEKIFQVWNGVYLTPIRELWTENPQTGNIKQSHLWT